MTSNDEKPSTAKEGKKPGTDIYLVVNYDQSLDDYRHFRHASHCMIYALNNGSYWNFYPNRALVLMQMRFDGFLGFPGGLVDGNEDPVTALNRELHEEVGVHMSRHPVARSDHVRSYADPCARLVLHFFMKQVPTPEFLAIERGVLSCEDYGGEVLGVIRPPLYTMHGGQRGLPAFLGNNFIGNARDELCYGLVHASIMTREEIDEALTISRR